MQIKKLTAVIAIAFLIVFSFVGCKNKGNTSSDSSGTVLAAWRILRCNPWGGSGYDPVPPKGRWHN